MFDFKIRWTTVVAMVALLLWLPVGLRLPAFWGWENGPIENSQLVVLALGAYASFRAAMMVKDDRRLRNFWLWSLPVWGMAFARELSWGRVFFPLTPPGVAPMFIPKEDLWYGAWLDPVVGVLLVVTIIGLVWNFRGPQTFRKLRFPVAEIILFLISLILFHFMEDGNFPQLTSDMKMTLEEYAELVMWWCLASVIWINGKPYKPQA